MRALATLFGIGHLRPAPGTWASLATLPVFLAAHLIGGPWLTGLILIASVPLGLRAAQAEMTASGQSDPAQVVIDEFSGQWLALMPLSIGAWFAGAMVWKLWPGWLVAFVLFRLFDISKPWIIGRADRRGDAWGVMLDDLLAGLFAALVTVALAVLAHLVLV